MVFGIIGGVADVKYAGRTVSYGVFQHEGTYSGYRKSKAAKKYKASSPVTGYGIKADHFITRAWDKHIKNMVDDVRKFVVQQARKATGQI